MVYTAILPCNALCILEQFEGQIKTLETQTREQTKSEKPHEISML